MTPRAGSEPDPFWLLGPRANDEYDPAPVPPAAREARRRARDAAEHHARRLGLSRRDFLSTLGGAATMLVALGACSKDEAAQRGTEPGGTLSVPDTAPEDPDVADDALGGEEYVFDVQTHLLDYRTTGAEGNFGAGFPQAACGADDPRDCFGVERWFDEVFLRSDTTMAVISALPIVADPHPLSIEVMERARDEAGRVCPGGPDRVLLHGQANPNIGTAEETLDGMRGLVAAHDVAAWKVYTHAPGPPWRLDDADPDGAPVGEAFLATVEEIGPRIVCVHKGLGDAVWASPADLGPAALAHPEVAFVAYHSGYETSVAEGPYVPGGEHRGIDRLVETVIDHGPGGGANVYAELGSTWWNLLRDPDQAAHALGKLLLHLGEDNVLWGTDSIWYGSPQEQVQAFRAFEISERLQEEHGYPPLTAPTKAKILGANAARLYGVDPVVDPCRPSSSQRAESRAALGLAPPPLGPRTVAEARALRSPAGSFR